MKPRSATAGRCCRADIASASDWRARSTATRALSCSMSQARISTPTAMWRCSVAFREIKKRGATVVIISHRPNTLGVVDKLLVLRDGMAEAFGARDEVIARLTRQKPVQAVVDRRRHAVRTWIECLVTSSPSSRKMQPRMPPDANTMIPLSALAQQSRRRIMPSQPPRRALQLRPASGRRAIPCARPPSPDGPSLGFSSAVFGGWALIAPLHGAVVATRGRQGRRQPQERAAS